MMDNSFYLTITFLSSHHKHLLLIISVSSTNSSSSSDVTTNSNPDDSPVTNKTPNPTMEEVKEWDNDQLLNWIRRNCSVVKILRTSKPQKSQGCFS
jgi:hypothetical protein